MFRDNLKRNGNYANRLANVKKLCASVQYHKAVCVFKWSDTPEGKQFWKRIYFDLKEHKEYIRKPYEIENSRRKTYHANSKTKDFCVGYYGALVSRRIVIKYFYLYAMELHWFLFKKWIH
jgi:hypothetical protein